MLARRHPAPDGPSTSQERTENRGEMKHMYKSREVQRKVASLTVNRLGRLDELHNVISVYPYVTLQRGEPVDDPQRCCLFISRVEQQSVAFARPKKKNTED